MLLIEDERSSREAVEAVLRLAGYRVRTASNGRDGLREIRHGKPDLVLTDISMPVLSGIELARALRQTDLDGMPIFALTSLDRSAIERSGGSELFDRILHKPIGLARLLALVDEALS